MIILGMDTSSNVASMAVLTEEKLLADYTVDNKKTHSEKMMKVLDTLLEETSITMGDVDAIAVSKGPGSFTGIRIGMASALGMSHALGIPMIGVNTLDGLAYNLLGSDKLLCPVINAQRGDVYTSLYRFEGDELKRLWDYEIADAESLCERLYSLDEGVTILGDGMPILAKVMKGDTNISPAPPVVRMPHGSSVAALGLRDYTLGRAKECYAVEPFYIRKSYAEEKWEERHGGEKLGE